MSDAVVIDTTAEFTAKAVPLLKEYVSKVQKLKAQFRRLREESGSKKAFGPDSFAVYEAEYDSLTDFYYRLEPAIRQLTQQVSGMVDQGNVTPLTRAELQIRLAELESLVDRLPDLIEAYRPVPAE